ncbi:MAG: hypothetical protein ABIG37_03755 [Nanoarchaeota archaeon]|nr:hypothetical protein [Nanoarchaeota archaeon]
MILDIILFLLSSLVLIGSATYLVKALEKISSFLKISEFTAAFIIMALATSIPELFVGISSAMSGNPSLSLGNVIGASIMNLTIIMGIFVLLGGGIKTKKKNIGKEMYFVLTSILLLTILFLIGNSISRIDGFILILFFIFNSYRMIKKRKKFKAKFEENHIKRIQIIMSVVLFMISLGVLFVSSGYVVKYASLLALDLKLPKIVVGFFLISIATTLPELIFGVRAIKLGHKEMAVGDQTGTTLVNITLIVGIVAIIKPITPTFIPFITSAIFLFISAFIFTAFLKSGKELKIEEGIGLILLYLFFMFIQLAVI